jgi:hypothetical protein
MANRRNPNIPHSSMMYVDYDKNTKKWLVQANRGGIHYTSERFNTMQEAESRCDEFIASLPSPHHTKSPNKTDPNVAVLHSDVRYVFHDTAKNTWLCQSTKNCVHIQSRCFASQRECELYQPTFCRIYGLRSE